MKSRTLSAIVCRLLLLSAPPLLCCPAGAKQDDPKIPPGRETPLAKAVTATELPLGAWGPYDKEHLGPCYLSDRLFSRMFAFPIVIGQRRQENIQRPFTTPAGKLRTRPERVFIERRAMGLSPVQAANDDRAPGKPLNRRAQVTLADASGLLWGTRIAFAPAELTQELVAVPGAAQPTTAWGEGEATVEYFPAYIDQEADGLLIRITLTNRSSAPQTYFVDLLGGMDAIAPQFAARDLSILPDTQEGGLIVQHAKSDYTFALLANKPRFTVRTFRVANSYFAPESSVTGVKGEATTPQPAGMLPLKADARPRPDPKEKPAPASADPGIAMSPDAFSPPDQWGLLRVDDIAVDPGQTETFFLCVGVGKDGDSARESAFSLLSVADDSSPFGKAQQGAYTKVLAAHAKASYQTGDESLNRLMAQSLANVPFELIRRVGVPTREDSANTHGSQYYPGAGGAIALAWSFYRPDWAVSQLNAWFGTRGNADAPLRPQAAPPISLFALSELTQRVGDRAVLARFYPFARHRYLELMAAVRPKDPTALLSWPPGAHLETAFARHPAASVFAPELSAYALRSAKILRTMSDLLDGPKSDRDAYDQDIKTLSQSMNMGLWNAKEGRFAAITFNGGTEAAPTVFDLMPLISGELSSEQKAALIKTLSDPAGFWSDFGVRTAPKNSPAYHPDAAGEGAVQVGPNWLLWKSLLDAGETDLARKLAKNVTTGYRKAQTASGTCPEWLNGDTGAAGGASGYSGDACAALPLYAAYHMAGTVSTGWDTIVRTQQYDAATDSLHLVMRSADAAAKPVLLCVMGKPNSRYSVTGSATMTETSDANGLLALILPTDLSTRQIDVVPAKPEQRP